MPTQSLVLRGQIGRRLTIAEMDNNFLYLEGLLNCISDGGLNNSISCDSHHSKIIGGENNRISYCSPDSVIGAGISDSIVCYSCKSSIISGEDNLICCGSLSTILGGCFNRVTESGKSSVIGGYNNQIRSFNTYDSIVQGGCGNVINYQSRTSGIFAGNNNYIYCSAVGNMGPYASTTIVGGSCNVICCNSPDSSILGGRYSIVNQSTNSVILGGYGNQMCYNNYNYDGTFCSSNSAIVGGYYNCILGSSLNSSILGGKGNVVCDYSYNSTVIGGCYNSLQNNSCDSTILVGRYNCMYETVVSSSIIGGLQTV
jgi:hypothetical protein